MLGSFLNGKDGLSWGDCEIRTEMRDFSQMFENGYTPHAYDEVGEKGLWNPSNQLLQTDFQKSLTKKKMGILLLIPIFFAVLLM